MASEWTVDTLKEHLEAMLAEADRRYEQRFKDSGTAVDAALNAAKEAVTKAEGASEKRFEGVNEFRATLGDQQRTLMPRPEAELRFKGLEDRMGAVEKVGAERGGQKSGGIETRTAIISALGAIGVLIGILAAFGVFNR